MKFSFLVATLFCINAFAEVGVKVDVTLNPVGSFKATTNNVKGSAVKAGDSFKATNIVVELKDLKTGIGLRDEHMHNKYLEVDKYPQAILSNAEGKGGKGKGMLKLHGVEKEINGTYEINGNLLTANFPLKISDFKIPDARYKGVGVEDEVQVHVTVPVTAAVAPSPTNAIAPAKPKK